VARFHVNGANGRISRTQQENLRHLLFCGIRIKDFSNFEKPMTVALGIVKLQNLRYL